ncbi:MAG: hypothetical protein JXN63_08800 [Candidatus Delongbacteria bacterium]|nr:hypothetical protein [Candidatus Delongbacteria bacterium]
MKITKFNLYSIVKQLIVTAVFAGSLFASEYIFAGPVSSGEIRLLINENVTYIQVPLQIDAGGYIYANPKGPGTGRPLELYSDDFDEVLMPKAEKYQPAQGDYVFIYRGSFDIYLPLKDTGKDIEQTIELRALYCTSSSCEEIVFTRKFTTDSYEKVSGQDMSALVSVPVNISSNAQSSQNDKSEFSLPESFSPEYLSSGEVTSLLPALLFGLLAGLILNFMPCVLPVISLKLLSLVRHAQSRRSTAFAGAAYSSGILVSYAFLASLSAFAGKNWGSLFQSPLFISASVVLIVSLALAYFGVYPLPQLSFSFKQNPDNLYMTSFLQGLFATLLATPCSGPFLGAVLAWALSKSTAVIFSVFLSIGAGMALPFFILSLFPKMGSRIPKGGSWQGTLEKSAGFLLLISALYFIHLLSGNSVLFTLSAVLASSVVLSVYGHFAMRLSETAMKTVPVATIALIIVLFFFLHQIYSAHNSHEITQYTHSELALNRDKIHAVIFTAEWCPNCRTVEATVFNSSTLQMLRDRKISILKADLTESGSEGEQLLTKLGSRSIPFLAIFPKGEGGYLSPLCLRDLYTKKDLIEALNLAESLSSKNSDTVIDAEVKPVFEF